MSDFLDCLIRSNSCPGFFQKLCLIVKFVEHLFILWYPWFPQLHVPAHRLYWQVAYTLKSFCELNFTSNGLLLQFLGICNIPRFQRLKHWHFWQVFLARIYRYKSICVPHLDFNSLDSGIPLKFFLSKFSFSLYLLSSFFWWDFRYVASFPFSFCLLLCSSFSLGFLVFSSLSCFVQHTSIMAEFSHYCQSCDSNSLHWLMFDISPHPLLETDKVSGDVMVGG